MSFVSPTQRRAGFQEVIQFEVLRRLQQSPDLSQRLLARELGISLGSINYCFQALLEKGWIKVRNTSQSKHRLRYTYLLTPEGILQKSRLTVEFLRRKTAEYQVLRAEIDALKREIPIEVHAPEDEGKL